MSTKKKGAKAASESQAYQAMLEEVEQITTEVSAAEADLDEMVEKIERGYGLLKNMKKRLDDTKMKVEKLRGEQF